MKQLLLFSMFMFCGLTLSAQFLESFEGTGLPVGWDTINNGSPETWHVGTPDAGTAHSGTQVVQIFYNSTIAHDDYLITPQVSVVDGTTDGLTLWGRNRNTMYLEEFNILISTTGTAEADFTITLDGPIAPPTTWTEYNYDLSAYEGQGIYIAFQAISLDEWQLYLDDVEIGEFVPVPPPTTCPTILSPPNGATDVRPVDVNTFFILDTAVTDYYFMLGTSPSVLDTFYTAVNDMDTIFDYQEMDEYGTTYYWQIIPYNSGGALNGCSVQSFTTIALKDPPASSGVSCTSGYLGPGDTVANFSSALPTGWTGDLSTGTAAGLWHPRTGTTTSTGTGPDGAIQIEIDYAIIRNAPLL